eukprot:GSChrysophyteH1.ASY1.ANO1.944.1 assembled CDS
MAFFAAMSFCEMTSISPEPYWLILNSEAIILSPESSESPCESKECASLKSPLFAPLLDVSFSSTSASGDDCCPAAVPLSFEGSSMVTSVGEELSKFVLVASAVVVVSFSSSPFSSQLCFITERRIKPLSPLLP